MTGGQSQIGYAVRRERLARKVTQAALADAAGIRQHTLYRLETGRIAAPRADTLARLARALGVTMERLTQGQPRRRTRKG